jgi:DNA (cytosine-5)-methyltransferase 1
MRSAGIIKGFMNELHLFAGAGGGILAGQLLGHRTVCAVEYDAYAQSVLAARQNDGTFPPFPIWDDVRTFDGKFWRGIVDVVAGGFPCQDISSAGKGAGLDGERSGLWSEFARIIGEVRPQYAFIENSPALLVRGLDRVLCDLTALGFDAEWGVMGAADVGANHQRDRVWILARDSSKKRFYDGKIQARKHIKDDLWPMREFSAIIDTLPLWESGKSGASKLDDGVAYWAHEFECLGNGQVPAVAAKAFGLLEGRMNRPVTNYYTGL